MPATFSRFDASPPAEGFMIRDVLRFFTVDIIVTASLTLLELIGFFKTIDQHVMAILVSKVVIFLYLVWLVRDRREAWPETGAATAGKWYVWPLALLVYIAGCYAVRHVDMLNRDLMTRLYAFLGLVYEHRPQLVMILTFENILTPPVRIALVVMIALAGPFLEELAFRGMMMDAYRRKHGALYAILATGALFGLYHFSLPFLLPLSALGVVFGIVRVLAKTLWCSVFVHCLHNTLTLLIVADSLEIL